MATLVQPNRWHKHGRRLIVAQSLGVSMKLVTSIVWLCLLTIARSASGGQVLWSIEVLNETGGSDDEGVAIALDSWGRCYITGWLERGTTKMADVYVGCWDEDGIYQWESRGSNWEDENHFGRDLVVKGDSVYVAAEVVFNDLAERPNFYLACYNHDGDLVRERRLPTNGSAAPGAVYGLSQCYTSGIILLGHWDGDWVSHQLDYSLSPIGSFMFFDPTGNGSRVDNGDITHDGNCSVIECGNARRVSGGSNDIVVAKYNIDLSGLQYAFFPSSEMYTASDNGSAIVTDSENNIYVTGYVVVESGQRQLVTFKMNPSLGIEWSHLLPSVAGEHYRSEGIDIAVDGNDNVYVTGRISQTSTGVDDIVTIKYSKSSSYQWHETWDGASQAEDRPVVVGTDNLDNVYVVGETRGNNFSDWLVLQYNAAGVLIDSVIWDGHLEADIVNDAVVRADGTVYVTGYTSTTDSYGDNIVVARFDLNNSCQPRIAVSSTSPLSIQQQCAANRSAPGHADSYEPGRKAIPDLSYPHAPNQLIVKFDYRREAVPNLTRGVGIVGITEADEVLGRFQLSELRTVFSSLATSPLLKNTVLITVEDEDALEQLASDLLTLDVVEYVEPNYLLVSNAVPNDPDFGSQWALPKIEAPGAWDITHGSRSTIIAIIDSGVDWDHPDLATHIWNNTDETGGNGIDDDGNGFVDDKRGWDFQSILNVSPPAAPGEDIGTPDNDPMDRHGHGSHCAGIAAASTNNGIGVAGLGWNCTIMPIRAAYSATDGKTYMYFSDAAPAYEYAADNGARVINFSFDSGEAGTTLSNAAQYAFERGVVVCYAAGNYDANAPGTLGNSNTTLAVAATDNTDSRASFSNFGSWIDVSAPGVGIRSTLSDGTYDNWNGTSMAAPHVAGLAALVFSINPSLTATQVINIVRDNADNIDAQNPSFVGQLGNGRINARRSLQNTPGNFVISNVGIGSAPCNLDVHISESCGWLTLHPSSFTVPIGGSQRVTPTVDWVQVGCTQQDCNVTISSNDSFGNTNLPYVVRAIPCGAAAAPTLFSPANGAANLTLPVTLDWNDVFGASKYQVQVDDHLNFSSPEIDQQPGSSNYSVSNLAAGTTYYWRARAQNSCGWGNWSTLRSFTTGGGDINPPQIVSPASTFITGNSAVISWRTDEAATTLINYGTTTAYGSSTPLDATLVIVHHQPLLDLSPLTTYHYRVRSRDAAGNEAISTDNVFTTFEVLDDLANGVLPTVSSTYPGYSPLAITDGVLNPYGGPGSTWSSIESTTQSHWVEIDFGSSRQVGRVEVYWANRRFGLGRWMTSQQFSLQSWNGSSFVEDTTIINTGADSCTFVNLRQVTTTRLRFFQPANMGPASYPGVLWIAELAIFGLPSNLAPNSPILQSPTDGSRTVNLTPVLTVANSTDPDNDELFYQFQLRETDTIILDTVISQGPSLTRLKVPFALALNTQYEWRTRAFDGQMWSLWSSVWQFTTPASDLCGDGDGNGVVDLRDVVYFVNFVFAGGPSILCVGGGDVNCDDRTNITDAVSLVNYLFVGGVAPCAACP